MVHELFIRGSYTFFFLVTRSNDTWVYIIFKEYV